MFPHRFRTVNKLRYVPHHACSGGRAALGVGLRPLTYWDSGFECRRGHGCLSLVSIVWCQVEVSASGRSIVQIPTTWPDWFSITILNTQLAFTENYFGHICHFRHKSPFPAKITTLGSKLKYRASSEPYTLKRLRMNLTMEFNASSDSDPCA